MTWNKNLMEKKNKSKIWVLNTSGVNRLLARMATKVEKTHCLDCVEIRKSIEHQHSPLFAADTMWPATSCSGFHSLYLRTDCDLTRRAKVNLSFLKLLLLVFCPSHKATSIIQISTNSSKTQKQRDTPHMSNKYKNQINKIRCAAEKLAVQN